MKIKYWIMVIIVILMANVIPTEAHAAVESSLHMKTPTTTQSTGTTLEVSITGADLVDLYAYELVVSYDASMLRFKSAETTGNGFSVEPKVLKGQVTLAHTKVGKVSGENGSLVLANLFFEAVAPGDAEFKLTSAKLVDSKLMLVEKTPSIKSTIIIEGRPLVGFTDITGHWAEHTIVKAVNYGYVKGYPDGTFRPLQQITRVEFSAMLIRALGYTLDEAADLKFADAKQIPAWAAPYISSAVKAKLIIGYEDNTFRGNDSISRAETAALMVRALSGTVNDNAKPAFVDEKEIAAWAKPYVTEAAVSGLMQGRGAGQFVPKGELTRAEAVKVIMNLIELK